MSHQQEPGPVTVFKSNDPALLAFAQSLLEGANIDFIVAGESVRSLFPGGTAGVLGVPEIKVPAENAEEARALLKDLDG